MKFEDILKGKEDEGKENIPYEQRGNSYWKNRIFSSICRAEYEISGQYRRVQNFLRISLLQPAWGVAELYRNRTIKRR